MNYYFNGSEIFINKVTFLDKTICENYDYLHLSPIIVDETFDKNEIKSEIHSSGSLWTEEFKKNQITHFTFNVFSEEQIDVVLLFDISPSIKLWLNDEIIFSKNEYECGIYCRSLKKGKNIFYGEFFANRSAGSSLACRLSSYSAENNKKYDNIVDSKSFIINNPSVSFWATDEASYINSKEYIDCIFPRDIFKLDINKNIILDILPGGSNEIADSLQLQYNTRYVLDLDKYRALLTDNTHYIILKYSFIQYDGNVQTACRMVVIKNYIDEAIKMIKEEKETNILWRKIYNDSVWSKKNPQEFYIYYLKLLKKRNMLPELLSGDVSELNLDINYFQSKLDGKIEKYFIRRPIGYDENKKYPLFLYISIGHSCDYHPYFIHDNDYFIAEASGRGVTGGSCIGDASILEILSYIKQNYNIDDEKIYLAGYSNGGIAAINLLQHYPDRFAGSFTISARCNHDLLCNIENKKCINIYSDFDIRNPNKCFSDESISNNFADINCPTVNHRFLSKYIAQKTAFNELLNYSTEPYPKHIHAKTYSLQHRKYYWFEFLDISFGFIYAEADVTVCDNKIKINIKNCNKFKIQIPLEMHNQTVFFYINGQKIKVDDSQSNDLIFEKSDNGFYISQEKGLLSLKGTGLLTVYYDSLQVYTTGKDPLLKTVANNFVSPCTNGFDSGVYTEYPIKDTGDFDSEKNAVFIDDLSRDNIAEIIRPNLFVKLSKDGFEHDGKKYYGDYSIFQIIYSPFNKNKTILHVSTNNKSVMKKNLFLRKVILSFDFNGINPYWNSEALIFYNNNYYVIYEKSSPMKPLISIER